MGHFLNRSVPIRSGPGEFFVCSLVQMPTVSATTKLPVISNRRASTIRVVANRDYRLSIKALKASGSTLIGSPLFLLAMLGLF